MTITLDIKPEVRAELARQAVAQGRAIEAVAAEMLEEAVRPESSPLSPKVETIAQAHGTAQALVDAFAEMRGLLTDEEIDRMFTRNPSTVRRVDLS